jgi:hypothetical protein
METKSLVITAVLLFARFTLGAQEAAEQSAPAAPDGENAVGLTLREVFAFYGQPDTVHAVRGAEEWQDDVVFVYDDRKLDIYIYKDRVWQVRVEAALGLKKNDQKTTALRVLGEKSALGELAEDKGDHLLYRYPASVWPKYARFNIDALGRISAIYIYRPDM